MIELLIHSEELLFNEVIVRKVLDPPPTPGLARHSLYDPMSGFLIKFKTSLLVICLCVMYLAKLGLNPRTSFILGKYFTSMPCPSSIWPFPGLHERLKLDNGRSILGPVLGVGSRKGTQNE